LAVAIETLKRFRQYAAIGAPQMKDLNTINIEASGNLRQLYAARKTLSL
jgi:hypothetical protein